MNREPHLIPGMAITGIATGLILMALFTTMWAGIANGGLHGKDHYAVITVFSLFTLAFISYSIRLFIVSKKFPKFTTEEDRLEGKRFSKSYGIIFGIEGTAIPLVCVLLSVTANQQFILPAIALIVGLHFYPMAKIFHRKLDYYLATWTCLVALVSLFSMIKFSEPITQIQPFLGVGIACATVAYGINMLIEGQRLTRLQLNH
jgi:hypothetical protein